MPLYVKDGSRTETLSSFRIPLSIFWNYFQNQNKRTSVGLRKSESNQAAVNKYGSGNVSLPTVDQTAYPEQIFTPPFTFKNTGNSSLLFGLNYPSGGGDKERIVTIQGSNSLNPANWKEVAFFNGQDKITQSFTQQVLNMDIQNKRWGGDRLRPSTVPNKFLGYYFFDYHNQTTRTTTFDLTSMDELNFQVVSGQAGQMMGVPGTASADASSIMVNDESGKGLQCFLMKMEGAQPADTDPIIWSRSILTEGGRNEFIKKVIDVSAIAGNGYLIFHKQTDSLFETRHIVTAIQGLKHRTAKFLESQDVTLNFNAQGHLSRIGAKVEGYRPYLANTSLANGYRWYRIGVQGPTSSNIDSSGSIIEFKSEVAAGLDFDMSGIDNWWSPKSIAIKVGSWRNVQKVFTKYNNGWINTWPPVGGAAVPLPPAQEGAADFNPPEPDAPVTDAGYSEFDDYENGLYGRRYRGYFADNSAHFVPRNVGTETNISSIWKDFSSNAERYSWEWKGYIFVEASGVYTFRDYSDDASYFWLGDEALRRHPRTTNSLINHGGKHAPEHSGVVTKYLTKDVYYPVRIQWGENTGADIYSLQYKIPNNSAWYYSHSTVKWTHVADGYRTRTANTSDPQAGFESTLISTDTKYPLPHVSEAGGSPNHEGFLHVNNTAYWTHYKTGTVAYPNVTSQLKIQPLMVNWRSSESFVAADTTVVGPDATSMIRECSFAGTGVTDATLDSIGLDSTSIDRVVGNIKVRFSIRPKYGYAVGYIKFKQSEINSQSTTPYMWPTSTSYVEDRTFVLASGTASFLPIERWNGVIGNPFGGTHIINHGGSYADEWNFWNIDVAEGHAGDNSYLQYYPNASNTYNWLRELVVKDVVFPAPLADEILIPFVSHHPTYVGSQAIPASATGGNNIDRIKITADYNGYNVVSGNDSSDLPRMTPIHFLDSTVPVFVPPPVRPNYPRNDNDRDNDEQWQTALDNAAANRAAAVDLPGNVVTRALGISYDADNDGDTTDHGDGCVVATHGMSTGGFSLMEKTKAEIWCVKTYHGKWYGESFRRGYRNAGIRTLKRHVERAETTGIDMSELPVYQEFKDFVSYGRGVKKGWKLGLRYWYRTITFIIHGMFLR
mgnify:FL=1